MPSGFELFEERINSLIEEGKLDNALAELKENEKYFSNLDDFWYLYGEYYEKVGDYENAQLAYERAMSINASLTNKAALGRVLISRLDYKNGIPLLKNIYAQNPTMFFAYWGKEFLELILHSGGRVNNELLIIADILERYYDIKIPAFIEVLNDLRKRKYYNQLLIAEVPWKSGRKNGCSPCG